jgi:leucyl aminopeptidase (aminopeptidase T)
VNDVPDVSFSRERQGALHIIEHCARLLPDETVAIICDPSTRDVAHLLAEAAQELGGIVEVVEISPLLMHGEEPDSMTARVMRGAAIVIGVTAKSMAHTAARRDACLSGARYLSLPDYSLGLLGHPAVAIDYVSAGKCARNVADLFTTGRTVTVTSVVGTNVCLAIGGRSGNCCPGYVTRAGELGSPPDVEANVAPLEHMSEGQIVVDGSIAHPEFGLLSAPIALTIEQGSIVRIEGDSKLVHRLNNLFDAVDPRKSRILAECGVGLNPQARLTGVMLTDEGALGTVHFGFGSNATVGGINDVPFHLDFVLREPLLAIDGRVILGNGKGLL